MEGVPVVLVSTRLSCRFFLPLFSLHELFVSHSPAWIWERCLCLLSDRVTVTPSYPHTHKHTLWTPASAPDSDWQTAVSHSLVHSAARFYKERHFGLKIFAFRMFILHFSSYMFCTRAAVKGRYSHIYVSRDMSPGPVTGLLLGPVQVSGRTRACTQTEIRVGV